jgi:hypothetical protein
MVFSNIRHYSYTENHLMLQRFHLQFWQRQLTFLLLLLSGFTRPFTWSSYLSESGSKSVHPAAFKTVPIHSGFKKGMKIEVVDRRNPILVRVATVADVLLRQIKVIWRWFLTWLLKG